MHKAGFVNIVGNPNVGKSTLMNLLVGERISIATFKAQTTRHRIMGILNTDEAQIVFSDTPGVLKPNYKLQEAMLRFSRSALRDADVLLYVTDMIETPEKNMEFIAEVNKLDVPVLVLINKIDLSNQAELTKRVEQLHALLPNAEILPISALAKFNVDVVLRRIMQLLPDSPPYFDKDQLTDKPARFFVTEIIREKILLHYDKEIPYVVEAAVELFKETEGSIYIRANIYVERDSQKGIIIGHEGAALKKVATEARRELEKFFDKKIFIELLVKIGDCKLFQLVTKPGETPEESAALSENLRRIKETLADNETNIMSFEYEFDDQSHDRFIRTSNNWDITLGRGLHFYQNLNANKDQRNYFLMGTYDLSLRPCLKARFTFMKRDAKE